MLYLISFIGVQILVGLELLIHPRLEFEPRLSFLTGCGVFAFLFVITKFLTI